MNTVNSLSKNACYNILYRILNLLFPLVTTTYVARVLMPDGIGQIAYALNIVQYFVLFAGLGIPNYGIREISKNKDNQIETNKIFSELFVLNFISTTLSIVVYFYIIFYANFAHKELHIIVGIILISNYINVDWFFQGNEDYKYIAIRNAIVKIVALAFLFIFVKERSDINKYAIIYSAAIGGNNILNIYRLRGKVRLIISKLNLKRHLKPVFILLASCISIELYTLVDVTMLAIFCRDDIIGYYNNASKFARMVNSLIASIGTILLPRLSYYYKNAKMEDFYSVVEKTRKVLLYFIIPAVVAVIILSKDIIFVLFGSAFAPAVVTLKILSLLIFAIVLNNFYGTQILITLGKENKLLSSVICGAAVNVLLNVFLIPSYQHNGAAIASVASELVVWFMTRWFAFKYLHAHMGHISSYIFSLVIASVCMAFCLWAICLCKLPILLELIVCVFVGALVYAIITFFQKNEVALLIKKKVKIL